VRRDVSAEYAKKGDWVEIQWVVLAAEERSPSVPPDTAQVPYLARVKGFLLQEARLGDTVEVETIIGRRMRGTLLAVNPPFGHNFGRAVPELLTIGTELRPLLAGRQEQ